MNTLLEIMQKSWDDINEKYNGKLSEYIPRPEKEEDLKNLFPNLENGDALTYLLLSVFLSSQGWGGPIEKGDS